MFEHVADSVKQALILTLYPPLTHSHQASTRTAAVCLAIRIHYLDCCHDSTEHGLQGTLVNDDRSCTWHHTENGLCVAMLLMVRNIRSSGRVEDNIASALFNAVFVPVQ